MTAEPAISVDDLTVVSPTGNTLLRDATFQVAAGRVLLIAGPSGSGKSTLIRLLSGLLARGAGWQVSGTLTRPGGTVDLGREDSDAGGLVFQNHALFDDLNAAENLRIVADHHHRPGIDLASAAGAVLGDIDPDQAVGSCSGGQRQRLAIARTLLSDPAILLFDEPNSGLDMRASRWLAAMIGDVCRRSGKPAIIVAHHVDDFLDLADQVLVLDPVQGRLRDVPVERAAIEAALLADGPIGAPAVEGEPAAVRYAWPPTLPRRARLYWFLRYLGEYLWLLFASPLTLLYVALGAGIVGFVTIWFGFSYHSFGGYLRAILHDETLEGLGFVLASVAVPFNTCILVVARNSAIIAADLGSRVAGMQFQAMRNLRLPGRSYIVASIMLSLALGSLVLVAVALLTAFAASLVTWHYLFPGQPTELFQELFFRKLLDPHVLVREGLWVALKVALSTVLGGGMAVIVALGAGPGNGQITRLIASSIISGVSMTLLVHAVVMMFQFSS